MESLSRFPIESQKMEVVGRLATSVIHDVNNFLTLVQLNAALLEQGGIEEDEVREIAGKIGQACVRASELTRKVLDLARRRERVRKPYEVGGIVRNHTNLLKTFVASKATLVVDVRGEDLWVMGDPGDFEQLVMNLILNAVDALSVSASGEVRVECVERAVGWEGLPGGRPWVEVVVSDTGCGIAPDQFDRIFEPLVTSKPEGLGTGLGLVTVRWVVEAHGGQIRVESKLGEGSRFRVFLPLTDRARGDCAVGGLTGGWKPSGQVLLLVEDDPGIRMLTERILVGAGYEVLAVGDGAAAWDEWQSRRDAIDLLLTDLVLPDEMSGRDLAEKVLGERADVPVVYMSGLAGPGDGHGFLTETNFLQKPFTPEALKDAVAAALRRASGEAERPRVERTLGRRVGLRVRDGGEEFGVNAFEGVGEDADAGDDGHEV